MCCAVYVCLLRLRHQDVSDMESEVAVAGACDGEVPPRLEEVGSFAGLSSEEEVDASTITVASGGVVGEVDHEEVVTYSSSRIVATDEVCILVCCFHR